MMEIIHDMAPSAQLWFGGIDGSDNHLDFADRVTHLKQQGCKIIVDDLGWLIGTSYFQENEISTAITQFIQNNNGCYITSAGNSNGQMYTGKNYSVQTDKFLKFNNNTDELTFTSKFNGTLQVTFQWADDWFQPGYDFDLIVYDNNNNIKLTSSKRGYNDTPEEYGVFEVDSLANYKIKIKWFDYTTSDPMREIKIIICDNRITFPLASADKQVYGHTIGSNVIAVAATDVNTPLAVESFSSRGPAIYYSSGSGTYTEIQQPKITAADNVNTYVGQNGNFGNPFKGTSAAAPHLAGIAALYFEGFNTDGYTQFLSKIKSTSVAMSDGGNSTTWKKASGNGRADAYAAIAARVAENYVNTTVSQLNASGTNISSFDIWQSNSWNNNAAPKNFMFLKNSSQTLRSFQNIVNNEKYHNWNSSLTDVTNHKSFTISAGTTTLTANLKPIYNVQILNKLEETSINGGQIGFRDPWLIDNTDTKGPLNRGTIASALWYNNLSSPFSPNTSSNYKGIFLNQGITPQGQWQPPYYTIKANQQQNIYVNSSVGTREFYFQDWTATSASIQSPTSIETPVVFTNANAIVSANYKGHLISGSTSGFNSNSQRKIVRTSDGKYHMVYESMGSVWYSISSDGSIWNPEKRINLSNTNAMSPSIAFSNDGNDLIYITYQSDKSSTGISNPTIILAQYKLGAFRWTRDVVSLSAYTYNTNPVVTSMNGLALVIYKTSSSSGLEGKEHFINTSYNVSSVSLRTIPSTDANSQNPTVTANGNDHKYYLAYQQSTTSIKYVEWGSSSNFSNLITATPSDGGGYTLNRYPSISQSNGNVVLSWTANTPSITVAAIRRKTLGGTWSTIYQAGAYMSFTNNNSKYSTGEGAIIGWRNTYSNQTQFIKLENGVYGIIKTLSPTGEIQLSDGFNFNNIKAITFTNTGSAPYSVNPLNYNFLTLSKESENLAIHYGRNAIVKQKGNEFVYYLGDVKVDGQNIFVQFIC